MVLKIIALIIVILIGILLLIGIAKAGVRDL